MDCDGYPESDGANILRANESLHCVIADLLSQHGASPRPGVAKTFLLPRLELGFRDVWVEEGTISSRARKGDAGCDYLERLASLDRGEGLS
jgi:hypothetical protein